MLNTLASRLPRDEAKTLLGTVTIYPLTEEFQQAWDQLPPPQGNYQKQPYSALAYALTASTGHPVRLFGEYDLGEDERQRGDRMLLVSDAPLGHQLRPAVRVWERRVRGGPAEVELADLLPAPEEARPLAEYIQYRPSDVPRAPGWVFRIATWQVMRRLAAHPLRVSGGRSQRLHMDTDGSLLAWDETDLLRGRSQDILGMCRISARLTTRAGVEDLVLTFDAHVSRFRTAWAYAKNTWLYRGEDKPILRIPIQRRCNDDGTWTTRLHPGMEAVLEACAPSAIEISQEPLDPADARPSMTSRGQHAVGSGQGPRYMARLHEHVRRCLPELVELRYDYEPTIVIPERKETAGGFPSIDISSTGHQRILIVCLYATPSAYSRMLGELRALAGGDVKPVPGGDPVAVVEGVDVVTRHCPDLVRHGANNRAALIDDVLNLELQDGRLVVAWVETEYHPEVRIEPKDDAKPHLRRLLAKRGIPSQFIATDPPGIAMPRTKRQSEQRAKALAHSARSALRELFRLAGATGRHLRAPEGTEAGSHALDRDALLVGIHARRQQTERGDVKLVLTMVAVHAQMKASSWPTLMASITTQDWRAAAQGITDFHAGEIGTSSLGRTEEKAARTRAYVDEFLRKLVTGDRTDIPVVIFVDTVATRTIWPGLRDQSLGDGALPGDLLVGEGQKVAIVRLNDDVEEIGRPVDRLGGRRPQDLDTPGSPGRKPKLYRLAESSWPLWLFPRMSRVIDSKGGRAGTTATRWTLSAKDLKQLGKPWHSYTATEILVVRDGGFDPATLAALTARLCEHPVSWVGRTAFPVPLHLAACADLDHPDYRVGS